MKEILLTQGKVALVDDADYEPLGQYKWLAHREGSDTSMHWYAVRSAWNPRTRRRHQVRMHRDIIGAYPGQMVDHVNGNGLDNRRANLRLCTRAENVRNQIKQQGCASQYKGVVWGKHCQKWIAQIRYRGQRRRLGQYINETKAAHAYDAAARELFGDFARFNFPRKDEQCALRNEEVP